MRKLLLLFVLTSAAFAQEAKLAEGKTDVSKLHGTLPDKEYTAKTSAASFTAANGERVQRLDIGIPGASAAQVW